MGLLGLEAEQGHSDQHQAGKPWNPASFLRPVPCPNSVEWGQTSSLMFKTIIQWLQFLAIRKLQA